MLFFKANRPFLFTWNIDTIQSPQTQFPSNNFFDLILYWAISNEEVKKTFWMLVQNSPPIKIYVDFGERGERERERERIYIYKKINEMLYIHYLGE